MRVESSPTATSPEPIVFPPFRLDRRGGELTRAGRPLPLRPKTWAVLLYLAERPGALVTKEELLDAVWPDVAVTPDTLTKSIGELRLALGDDAATPRFIATVHRRGFRFIAATGAPSSAHEEAPDWQETPSGVRPFVGRTAELRELADRFAKACAGERQVVFVTGPAGVGKTTLVEAFLDLPAVHGAFPPVWVARGACIEQYGPREPYMPVLKALERLAHRTDAEPLIRLLARTAPTWLAQMPWLIGDDAETLRQSLEMARAERMLREFAALIDALTAEVPLVLVLEDLHWSDPATVDLLAELAQHREAARLLVIGTYRPAEVAVHEHVLGPAVRTMQLRRQCTELPIHELKQDDVESYLTARFPGGELPTNLVPRLHAHTDGNPLFLVAVVEHMLARGWILDTAPGWAFVIPEEVDLGVPDDARRMIATQIEGISPADRALLDAASVAGKEFAVQAIVAPLHGTLEEVEQGCETLARLQRFLRFAGSGDWPDGSSALRYAFTHEMYQRAVYEGIPPGRRQRLHQRIGEALEQAYGERAPEQIAAELAVHFERGRDFPRALRYLGAAAALARQRFAPREAIRYLEAAVALSRYLPDEAAQRRQELELRLRLAPLLSDLHGFSSGQAQANCERTHQLSAEVGTAAQRFQTLYALGHLYTARADPVRAPALAQDLDALAGELTPDHRLVADTFLARSAALFGRHVEARRRAEAIFAGHVAGEPSPAAPDYGPEPIIATTYGIAFTLWFLGDSDGAMANARRGVAAASQPGVSILTRAAALGHLTVVETFCRRPAEVCQHAEQLIALTGEHGLSNWGAIALGLSGWARAQQGEVRAGIEELERARVALSATGGVIFSTHILAFLSEALLRAGQVTAALAAIDEGLRVAETTLDRTYWPELWRLKGELLLAAHAAKAHPARRGARAAREGDGAGDRPWLEAESCLRRALELAREMEAKSLELRAATSLARAWTARGRTPDARGLLDDLCGWFGAESTSPDLIDARALLA